MEREKWEKRFDKKFGLFFVDRYKRFIRKILKEQIEEIIEKINKWDLEAIPRTDHYAKGWNDCRHNFSEGKKRFLEQLK